ncbi:adenosylcobinamide-GDP ribazoletransferase [Nitrosomonas sp.]|uniref:adenosylcobinamide-GDP ribazoletransferase n=1 Tax=Nitrosomonas sp. TaxID=42353 RepID=UPI0027320FD0|nr:adenosylcobinamide-GDP ribazoletransferase [Nitrosomonas sp.]MDP2225249.1 adenosylcobinamide-GDP ribazoletransferase [Nitrosomonas sp.]
MIKPFLISVQFLTRLPVRLASQPNEKDLGNSLLFYPLVGFIIGLILIGLGWLLSGSPPLVTAALLVTTWVLITGGLHLDGLADSADAWIGGMGDRTKTLAIMKDPNCGPAGVVAIVLILLLKFVALHSLVIANEWITMLLAIILARTLLPLLFLTTPYVRSNGLGTSLAVHQPRQWSIFVVVTTFVLMFLLTDIQYLLLSLTAVVTFLLLRHLMAHRIAGTTGDTAGALVEITETTVLLTSVIALTGC